MSADYTTWLVRTLGLPLLEETARGVRGNSAARRRLKDARPRGLADAVARCCGLAAPTPALERAVELARAGESQEVPLAEFKVAISAIEPGRVSAVVVPMDTPRLRERAAATDLAAGVSHELANALGAIAGWANLARHGGNVNEALSVIETSAETAWGIARNMLARVSGKAESGPTQTNLSELAEQVAKLIAPRALRNDVQIERRIARDVHVHAEQSELWSIVWNLALNAIEAMESGGTLLLQLTATDNTAMLVVSDDGPGMDPELQARIFEPYVTTKATGTGIGLATVKRAVDAMGGAIELDSALGRGTRFQITMPRVQVASAPATNVVRRTFSGRERSSGVFRAEHLGGRILVVDDDRALREMTATALQVRGAEVVAVGSAQEALATEGTFDVALIDMLLGEGSGDGLLKALREKGRIRRGLLMTGTDVGLLRLKRGGEPDDVLRKPFKLDDLFERVGAALRDSGTTDRDDASNA